jgi:hypothetical protein
MNRTAEEMDEFPGEVGPKIQTRLEEITRPDYVDPARTNLTGLDWVLFLGFLIVCAVGFTIWGY